MLQENQTTQIGYNSPKPYGWVRWQGAKKEPCNSLQRLFWLFNYSPKKIDVSGESAGRISVLSLPEKESFAASSERTKE